MPPQTTTTVDIEGRDIQVSNSEKVLYPEDGFDKLTIVDHYRSIADTMLPHLRGKPLVMRRFPDGITSEGFYQKQASDYFPDWVRVEPLPQVGSSAPIHHVVCDDAATLVYLVTQACLEFHVFLSTVDALDRPQLAIVDLDPAGGIELSDLRSITRGICNRFRDAGLTPHVQATGGKGFHVVAPLNGEAPFDEIRDSMQHMSELAAREEPNWLTVEHRKDKRGNRVFLDTTRNAYAQSMIAPYSLRARPGAPTATPLTLAELSRATPNGYGPANIRRRLSQKPDPWSELAHRPPER